MHETLLGSQQMSGMQFVATMLPDDSRSAAGTPIDWIAAAPTPPPFRKLSMMNVQLSPGANNRSASLLSETSGTLSPALSILNASMSLMRPS